MSEEKTTPVAKKLIGTNWSFYPHPTDENIIIAKCSDTGDYFEGTREDFAKSAG
jgi:hypothetical protein